MPGAVTFDFHNTLARCDAWFELEVRTLPASFLRWWAEREGVIVADAGLTAAAEGAYRRLRREIMDHGRELPAEACVDRVLGELAIPVAPAIVREGVEALMRGTLEAAVPIPGAVETVRAVAAAGVPLGIVSSAVYHPFLEWTLERFGIRGCFAEVVSSAGAGYYKSRPEIYWYATERLGQPPGRTVHVGDSYRFDVAGARRAGLRTVWLRADAADEAGEGGPPDVMIGTMEGAAGPILGLLDHGR